MSCYISNHSFRWFLLNIFTQTSEHLSPQTSAPIIYGFQFLMGNQNLSALVFFFFSPLEILECVTLLPINHWSPPSCPRLTPPLRFSSFQIMTYTGTKLLPGLLLMCPFPDPGLCVSQGQDLPWLPVSPQLSVYWLSKAGRDDKHERTKVSN